MGSWAPRNPKDLPISKRRREETFKRQEWVRQAGGRGEKASEQQFNGELVQTGNKVVRFFRKSKRLLGN